MKNKHKEEEETIQEQPDFTKLAVFAIVGLLVMISAVILIMKSTGKKSAEKIDTTNVKTESGKQAAGGQTATAPLRFTVEKDVTWNSKSGSIYPYTFSFPETLPLVVFINDQTDSVAIAWGNIPPQQNILLNMEFINNRDPKYLNQPKIEFVKNWYKFFSGLTGVSKLEPFTNTQGLKGYKAWYINTANTSPNIDVFFEVPKRNDIMIHMANGIIDPVVFDRILDSLKWETSPVKK